MDKRTKNRIREHNLETTDRISTQVNGHEGTSMELWECTDPDCNWKGWLPIRTTT